jgi:hypothetical protein
VKRNLRVRSIVWDLVIIKKFMYPRVKRLTSSSSAGVIVILISEKRRASRASNSSQVRVWGMMNGAIVAGRNVTTSDDTTIMWICKSQVGTSPQAIHKKGRHCDKQSAEDAYEGAITLQMVLVPILHDIPARTSWCREVDTKEVARSIKGHHLCPGVWCVLSTTYITNKNNRTHQR